MNNHILKKSSAQISQGDFEIKLNPTQHRPALIQKTLKLLPKIYGISQVNRFKRRSTNQNTFVHKNNLSPDRVFKPTADQNYSRIKPLTSHFKGLRFIRVSPELEMRQHQFYLELKKSISRSKNLNKHKFERYSKRYSTVDQHTQDYIIIKESKNTFANDSVSQQNNLKSQRGLRKILLEKIESPTRSLVRQESQTTHKVLKPNLNTFVLPQLTDSQMLEMNFEDRKFRNQRVFTLSQADPQNRNSNHSIIETLRTNKRSVNTINLDIKEQDQADDVQLETIQKKYQRIRTQPDSLEDKSYQKSINLQPSIEFNSNTYLFRLKQNQRAQLLRRSNQQQSNLSQSIATTSNYRIPNKEELPEFIQKYKSMDPGFDLREISQLPNFKIVPYKAGLYLGEYVNNMRQGLGVFISDKSIFEGMFINNLKFKGTESTPEGIYKGSYINGLREGKGEFKWINGEVYQGDWKNGLKHGTGTWKSTNGDYYNGEWLNNRQQGFGLHVYQGGVYKGYFKKFLKHGQGEQKFSNQDQYKGSYSEGKPNGHGQYTWKNGARYIGQFNDGMREGQGMLEQAGMTYRVAQVLLKMISNTVQVKLLMQMVTSEREFLNKTCQLKNTKKNIQLNNTNDSLYYIMRKNQSGQFQYCQRDNQKIKLVTKACMRSISAPKLRGLTLTKNLGKNFENLYQSNLFSPPPKQPPIQTRKESTSTQCNLILPSSKIHVNFNFYGISNPQPSDKFIKQTNQKFQRQYRSTCNSLRSQNSESYLQLRKSNPYNFQYQIPLKTTSQQISRPSSMIKPGTAPNSYTNPTFSLVKQKNKQTKYKTTTNLMTPIKAFDQLSEKKSIIMRDSQIFKKIGTIKSKNANPANSNFNSQLYPQEVDNTSIQEYLLNKYYS